MSDPSNAPLATDTATIAQICDRVYQIVLDIQQQHPELLKQKYRTIPWHTSHNQSVFITKLKARLTHVEDEEAKLINIRRFLEILLLPSYFTQPSFGELTQTLHLLIPQPSPSPSPELVSSDNSETLPSPASVTNHSPGIAILLLDAENLKLDIKTEKFLEELCTYPIQIKVAFANWRSLGKKDAEFHSRGYELIHVPPGKDSADMKMATVGASIFIHYPNAREILVCSSDGGMTHLYNTLQTHGFTVYLVRKQGDTITVLNSDTNQTKRHSLSPPPEIPGPEEFINQIKAIIRLEQTRTGNLWVELSQVSTLFCSHHHTRISHLVSLHCPGKTVPDFFLDYPNQFVLHNLPEPSGLYVTLFEMNTSVIAPNPSASTESPNLDSSLHTTIQSKVELEQELARIVKIIMADSGKTSVPISNVGTEFSQQHKQSVNQVLKDLSLGDKFITFLQDCNLFQIKKSGKIYSVTIGNPGDPESQKEIQSTQSSINSVKTLEKILKEMIEGMIKKLGTDDIAVNKLKKEFQTRYNETADACVKKFEPKSSLIKFLRNRDTMFNMTFIDRDYRVAIAK
ncbi:MAG: NYN domain-containing protein [Coleofasciculus chthonoplastes F3-SA18-01]|uniref:NYN domain-containing protein n=1 Tax=Coleofasciculus chthonoplastes TaxID=64178 RepID=UPI0032F7C8B8